MNEILLTTLVTAAQVFGVLLAVDFASGVLHWLEDSYGKASWPILGKHVVAPNILHHHQPRAFTKTSFWDRNSVTLVIGGLILLAVTLLGGFHWLWVLAALLAGISNEVHCWAHRSPRENGPVITFLQRIRLLQTPKAHAVHHTDPKDRSYCTMTNFLNPVLDYLRFFDRIEKAVFKLTGIKRRIDESVKPKRAERNIEKLAA